jgi:hypothetical protein
MAEANPLKYALGRNIVTGVLLILSLLLIGDFSISPGAPIPGSRRHKAVDTISIHRITPARPGGQGYRLVYHVNVPVAVYWRFKTDFDNNFLVENKYIRDHRYISRKGNTVITEDKYTDGPDVYFIWQTRLDPRRLRLDFKLLNPKACKEKYHYGHIQIQAEGAGTRVTQVAYFDFWGASFWAYYPWQGGMRDFLVNTARWEQATAVRLKDRYEHKDRSDK